MKRFVWIGLFTTAVIFTAYPVLSQQVYIFPNKGQSQETMESDKYQCYQWARQQTGFDPSQPQYTTQVDTAPRGDAVRGAARGALVGAVVGEIASGDAGKGAAAGAAGGGLIGGMKRRDRIASQQSAQKSQQQAYANQVGNYNRAYAACLEGKGYTVK